MRVLVPFCVGYYVSYLVRTLNAVIAPELTRELALDPSALGLLTSTYFLAFALAQLPVGVALDRYGPRRVVSTLLAVGAAGMAVFAGGTHFSSLAVGRALAGLGVSACLMGAFKAFTMVFPARRLPSLTGVVMAAGAAGALSASLPLDWMLPVLGWRGSLLGVAALTAASAVLVAVVAPAHALDRGQPAGDDESLPRQLRTLAAVMGSRPFWRLAPQAALFTGGFMALQGLWIVPWLMTVEGRSRSAAAAVLLALNLGMLVGQLAIGLGAAALERAGVGRERLMSGGLAAALLVEALIVARIVPGPLAWFALGLFGAAGAQVYGVATTIFPAQLSGRVTTAINQLAFLGAFLIQWGIGGAVEALSRHVDRVAAYEITFSALWVAQAASVAWSAWSAWARPGAWAPPPAGDRR